MATMTEEDQTQKCSNSNSGGSGIGRSCKRPKQKKVPQRGLGVAQLEKIRLEEQQKKDADLPLPNPNFSNPNQPSSQIPFQSDLGPSFSLQNIDTEVSGAVPLANGVGFEAGWPSVPVLEHRNMPKFWNSYEFDFEKESYGVHPRLPSQSAISLPCDSNPTLPLQNWAHRAQQYPQPASSMVNVSLGTSSVLAVQYSMEPPSNQNYGGSYIPMQQPEEMVFGVKRPYPFSVDVPPAPNFNFKLPTFAVPSRTNETTSCGSGSGFNSDAGNPNLREPPSCSASYSEPNPEKSNKENENFNGDFLTLAPPTANSCIPRKFKSPPTFQAYQIQEYPDFEPLSFQDIIGHQVPHPSSFSHRFNQPQPLYNFFPLAAKAEVGQSTATIESSNGEVGPSIDLNLKL